MHDHRQLARNGDRSALEADLLPELQAPVPQGAIGTDALQDAVAASYGKPRW